MLRQAQCDITSYVYESHSAALIATEYCAEEISGVSNRFATSPGGRSNNTAPLFPAISAHTSPSPRVLCSCIELCRTTKPDLDKTASRSLSKTWKFFETFANICEQSPLYVQWLILITCKAGKAPSKRELWNKQRYFVWNKIFRLLAMI